MKLRIPDEIKLFCNIDSGISFKGGASTFIEYGDVSLTLKETGSRLSVFVKADVSPLFHIRFRWNFTPDEERLGVHILGDTWERSYGELEWRGEVPQRFMPWYMLVSNGSDLSPDTSLRYTEGFGVAVRPGAMCSWQHDPRGITLWMDVRCGGDGVLLGGRTLHVCDVLMEEYRGVSAFEAGRRFCKAMCPACLPTARPVYGSNNWYYAVGNSSHEQILRDTELVTSLTEGLDNPPYMVIDDGWQKYPCSGPWREGNERFPDMPRLAREITEMGAVPGLWVRFLRDKHIESGLPEECYFTHRRDTLDPSVPEVIEHIKETVRRFTSWGYKLIKHDFTMEDIFAVHGYERGAYLTPNGWSFRDRSRTTAEITVALYSAILDAADSDTVILACETPSHLTAGLAHLMRTGFDTSGRYFERTRISGVNALAFRLMQHNIFYAIDADCCGHTGRIDWALNREWLRILADSGTPLFISSDPDVTFDEQKKCFREAFKKAALQEEVMIPLDWMENTTPEYYLTGGKEERYRWYAEEGTHQFIPPTDKEY